MTAATVLATVAALPVARAAGDINSGTETAVDGPVSATISWDAGHGPRNMRLKITRNGAVGLDRTIPLTCGEQCSLYSNDAEDFGVRDLDGDGENEIVLRAGLDEPCCYALGIFDYRPADGSYREISPVFRSGFRIEDLNRDNRPEIISSDSRIDGGPVQIFTYTRTDAEAKLDDVPAGSRSRSARTRSSPSGCSRSSSTPTATRRGPISASTSPTSTCSAVGPPG